MKIAIRLALACAMAFGWSSAFAQDKVIRVGVLMPISGPGSYFGVMGREGVDLGHRCGHGVQARVGITQDREQGHGIRDVGNRLGACPGFVNATPQIVPFLVTKGCCKRPSLFTVSRL